MKVKADVSLMDKAGSESTWIGYRPLFLLTIVLNGHPFPSTTANMCSACLLTVVCAGKNPGPTQSHVAGLRTALKHCHLVA